LTTLVFRSGEAQPGNDGINNSREPACAQSSIRPGLSVEA
jgi:hypothetical protein